MDHNTWYFEATAPRPGSPLPPSPWPWLDEPNAVPTQEALTVTMTGLDQLLSTMPTRRTRTNAQLLRDANPFSIPPRDGDQPVPWLPAYSDGRRALCEYVRAVWEGGDKVTFDMFPRAEFVSVTPFQFDLLYQNGINIAGVFAQRIGQDLYYRRAVPAYRYHDDSWTTIGEGTYTMWDLQQRRQAILDGRQNMGKDPYDYRYMDDGTVEYTLLPQLRIGNRWYVYASYEVSSDRGWPRDWKMVPAASTGWTNVARYLGSGSVVVAPRAYMNYTEEQFLARFPQATQGRQPTVLRALAISMVHSWLRTRAGRTANPSTLTRSLLSARGCPTYYRHTPGDGYFTRERWTVQRIPTHSLSADDFPNWGDEPRYESPTLCADCRRETWLSFTARDTLIYNDTVCADCVYSRMGSGDDEWSSDPDYYGRTTPPLINCYSFRPDMMFMRRDDEGNGVWDDVAIPNTPYMGFELELELHNADQHEMGTCVVESNKFPWAGGNSDVTNSLFYLKEDGSIDYGFEVVSHPGTLDFFRNAVDWNWMETLRNAGARAWSDQNCGLHIHVSKEGWQTTGHFARWWMLMMGNSDEWAQLAGRRSNYARWTNGEDAYAVAKRAYAVIPAKLAMPEAPDYYRHTPKQVEELEFARRLYVKYHPNKLAKKAEINQDRYSAINVQNSNTVELRFWRPSMRHTTVLAALEATSASVEFAKLATKDKATTREALSWGQFEEWASTQDYPYLNARIQERMHSTSSSDNDS